MRLTLAIFVVLVASSTAGLAEPPGPAASSEPHYACDPVGPPRPRAPTFEHYLAAELFPDEVKRFGRGECKAPAADALLEDDAIKNACAEAFSKPKDNGCRHACPVHARVAAAIKLHQRLVDDLNGFPAKLDKPPEACAKLVSTLPVTASDSDARPLWTCLGLTPLPSGLKVQIVFKPHCVKEAGNGTTCSRGELDNVEVEGELIPGTAPIKLVSAIVSMGCGLSGRAVVEGVPGQ